MGIGNGQKTEKGQKAEKKELILCPELIPLDIWELILDHVFNDCTYESLHLSETCKHLNRMKKEKFSNHLWAPYVSSNGLEENFMLSFRNYWGEMKDGVVLVSYKVDLKTTKVSNYTLVINLNKFEIPKGVDPKKVQYLVIGSNRPLELNAAKCKKHVKKLKALFPSGKFSNVKSVMIYNLGEFDNDLLSLGLLDQLNPKRLYIDQFNLDESSSPYFEGFYLLRTLRINPISINHYQLPPQLTDFQIHISSTTQVKFNSNLKKGDVSRISCFWSSLENLKVTCDPDYKGPKIYFELLDPSSLRKVTWMVGPNQGRLIFFGWLSISIERYLYL